MTQARFTFSKNMDLATYEANLQAKRVSPKDSVGSDYGSFLGAYLTHHLMNPPAGMSAEDVLVRDKAQIKQLLEHQGCLITFNRAKQLPEFFKFLTSHVTMYLQLVDLGFLKTDEQCEDGNTFLNTYFSEVLIDTPQKAKEAIALVEASRSSLVVANQAGMFPLYAFFDLLCQRVETCNPFKEPMNDELIDQWKALVDAFALDKAHPMKVDELLEQCVEFYHYHNTSKASAFLYHLLTQAVNYGVSLHQPMKGLDGLSFMVRMLMNRNLAPMTLRHYYFKTNQASHGVTFKCIKSVEVKKFPFRVNAKTGVLEGLVCVPNLADVPPEFEKYRVHQFGFKKKVFNPAIAAEFFPISILNEWYFPVDGGFSRSIMTQHEANYIPGTSEDYIRIMFRALHHVLGGNYEDKELGVKRGVYIKMADIPEAKRFGVPIKTKNNQDVFLLVKSDGYIVLKINTPLRYVDPTDKHFTPGDYQKVKNFMDQNLFWNAFDQALLNEANYFAVDNLFYQLGMFGVETESLNLLEYYLRNGGNDDGGDPRCFYQFSTEYERKAFFPKALCSASDVNCFYASGDGHHAFYGLEDFGEKVNVKRNHDTAILFHLSKMGYSFKTKVVEDEVKHLLETGNYADPAFYRLMRCLCECAAPLPKTIGDQSFADYVSGRLLKLSDKERKDAASAHIEQVLALFNEKPNTAAKGIRDYFASFGLSMPGDCETAEAMSRYLESQKGLTDFLVAMDIALPKMNEAIFNTRGSLEDFADSVEGNQGDAKRMLRALDHYLRSGDYTRGLPMEEAYYQLYRGLMINMCEALEDMLQKTMKGGADQLKEEDDQPKEESVKKPSLLAIAKLRVQATTKGLKATKRNRDVGQFVENIYKFLKTMANLSPGDADGRRRYLENYLKLCDHLQWKIKIGEENPNVKLRSQSIRTVLSRFLSGDLLKNTIVLDEEAKGALDKLMKTPTQTSDGSTTPGDSDDEDVERLMAATVLGSAPLEGESDHEDEGDYVSPDVPLDDIKLDMPSVGKSIGMFSEKERISPSAEFLSTIDAYRQEIDALFYGDKSRDTLIAVIHHLNAKLDEGVALDAVGHLICPITKRIPFYPCGLKEGGLAYLDAMAFTSYYGKAIKGMVVNEASFDRLTPRELMLFFTHLQAVDRSLQASAEARPAPKVK